MSVLIDLLVLELSEHSPVVSVCMTTHQFFGVLNHLESVTNYHIQGALLSFQNTLLGQYVVLSFEFIWEGFHDFFLKFGVNFENYSFTVMSVHRTLDLIIESSLQTLHTEAVATR